MKYFLLVIVTLVLLFSGCREPVEKENPYRQEAIPWPTLLDSDWPVYRHDLQGTSRTIANGPTAITEKTTIALPGFIWASPSIDNYGSAFVIVENDTGTILVKINEDLLSIESHILNNKTGIFETYCTPTLGDYSIVTAFWSTEGGFILSLNNSFTEDWKFNTSTVYQSIIVDQQNNYYYNNLTNNSLVSLSMTGSLRWEKQTHGGYHNGFSAGVITTEGSRLVISSNDSLFAINTNGSIECTFFTGATIFNVVIDNDNRFYFYNEYDSTLNCINENFNMIWSKNIQSYGLLTLDPLALPTLDWNGHLYFSGSDINHNSALLSVKARNGDLRWVSNIASSDLACDGESKIYTGWQNTLSCLSNTGEIIWQIYTSEMYMGLQPIIANNTVYFTFSDSKTILVVR